MRCPKLVANRRWVVAGYGDPAAQVMIVGEAPGRLGADRTGVPFTGDRSGRRLQGLLIALGLSAESDPAVEAPRLAGAFLSNVVRCNPPANRTPTAGEVSRCAPYLRAELAQIHPQVLVTLGGVAAAWAFGELLGCKPPAGVRALHGRTWQAGDMTLLCLVHPARASRQHMAIADAALRRLLLSPNQPRGASRPVGSAAEG